VLCFQCVAQKGVSEERGILKDKRYSSRDQQIVVVVVVVFCIVLLSMCGFEECFRSGGEEWVVLCERVEGWSLKEALHREKAAEGISNPQKANQIVPLAAFQATFPPLCFHFSFHSSLSGEVFACAREGPFTF